MLSGPKLIKFRKFAMGANFDLNYISYLPIINRFTDILHLEWVLIQKIAAKSKPETVLASTLYLYIAGVTNVCILSSRAQGTKIYQHKLTQLIGIHQTILMNKIQWVIHYRRYRM